MAGLVFSLPVGPLLSPIGRFHNLHFLVSKLLLLSQTFPIILRCQSAAPPQVSKFLCSIATVQKVLFDFSPHFIFWIYNRGLPLRSRFVTTLFDNASSGGRATQRLNSELSFPFFSPLVCLLPGTFLWAPMDRFHRLHFLFSKLLLLSQTISYDFAMHKCSSPACFEVLLLNSDCSTRAFWLFSTLQFLNL